MIQQCDMLIAFIYYVAYVTIFIMNVARHGAVRSCCGCVWHLCDRQATAGPGDREAPMEYNIISRHLAPNPSRAISRRPNLAPFCAIWRHLVSCRIVKASCFHTDQYNVQISINFFHFMLKYKSYNKNVTGEE